MAHNLLRDSRLLEELIELGAQVTILAQDTRILEAFDLPREVQVDRFTPRRHWLHDKWYFLTQYVFGTIAPSATSEAQDEWMRHEERLRFRAVKLVKRLGARRLLKRWIQVRRRLFPVGEARDELARLQPDVILVGTLGHSPDSYAFLRAAAQRGIPTLCNIASWDKLTVKEYVLERPDKLAVWNELNRDEAVALHGFAPGDVYVAGVPHFDLYAEPRTYSDRAAFCAAHGLDPARRLLLLTLQPLDICQNLDEVIAALARALSDGRFACACQLLIRPHPWAYFKRAPGKGTEEDLQRYEALHPFIRGNRPDGVSHRLYGGQRADHAPGLATALYHADVVLDYYGTVALEANLLQRPVVYIDNRSFTPPPPQRHARFDMNYAQFTHLQYPIQAGIGRTATTEAELIAAINDYLLDPNRDWTARRQAVRRLCFATDGRSSRRLAQAIVSLARGVWPPADERATGGVPGVGGR